MSLLSKLGKRIFPNVFVPPALRGLTPSWSGIILRVLNPTRTHPTEHYKITSLSRKEIKMLEDLEEQKLRDRHNPIFIDRCDKGLKKE